MGEAPAPGEQSADRIGPEVAAVSGGIDTIPESATSFAFRPRSVTVS